MSTKFELRCVKCGTDLKARQVLRILDLRVCIHCVALIRAWLLAPLKAARPLPSIPDARESFTDPERPGELAPEIEEAPAVCGKCGGDMKVWKIGSESICEACLHAEEAKAPEISDKIPAEPPEEPAIEPAHETWEAERSATLRRIDLIWRKYDLCRQIGVKTVFMDEIYRDLGTLFDKLLNLLESAKPA